MKINRIKQQSVNCELIILIYFNYVLRLIAILKSSFSYNFSNINHIQYLEDLLNTEKLIIILVTQ